MRCQDHRDGYDYDLFGVLVHSGMAEAGHYYSYIKERFPQVTAMGFQVTAGSDSCCRHSAVLQSVAVAVAVWRASVSRQRVAHCVIRMPRQRRNGSSSTIQT